jgi:hypothetical protein
MPIDFTFETETPLYENADQVYAEMEWDMNLEPEENFDNHIYRPVHIFGVPIHYVGYRYEEEEDDIEIDLNVAVEEEEEIEEYQIDIDINLTPDENIEMHRRRNLVFAVVAPLDFEADIDI